MSYLGKSANASTPYFYTAAGDGNTVSYALNWMSGSSHSLLVFIDGVHKVPGYDYTLSASIVTFVQAPPLNSKISIFGFALSGIINTVAADSITVDKLEPPILKSLANLTLSADKLIYSSATNTLAVTPFTAYARTFLETPDVATLRTNIGAVSLTTNQTIDGVKTFTQRPSIPNRPITYLSQAAHNSMFMIRDGKLYSTSGSGSVYGAHTYGRGPLNANPFLGVDNFREINFPNTSSVVKAGFASGYHGAHALLSDGSLYAWGANTAGQLGIGNTTATPLPTLSTTNVTDMFESLNQGYDTAMGRMFIKKSDGYIYGCGYNTNGQLGIGNTTNPISSWTQLTSLGTSVSKLFNMGANCGCVVVQQSDDTIWVAGYNANGQLGNGNTTQQPTFINVTTAWQGGTGWDLEYVGGGFGYYDTAANISSTLVMLLRNRSTQATKLLTCGSDGWGSIGNGATTGNVLTPYLVPNSGDVKQVTTKGGGPLNIHMLNNDGTLYAWGYGDQGQLGQGTTGSLATPTLVATSVDKLLYDRYDCQGYGYRNATFIKKTDGYIYATGYNASGQLAVGDTTNRSSFTLTQIPTSVDDIYTFPTSASGDVLIGKTANNLLYAWGYNGHNGITMGNTTNCLVPTLVNLPDD